MLCIRFWSSRPIIRVITLSCFAALSSVSAFAQNSDACIDLQASPVGAIFGAVLGCRQPTATQTPHPGVQSGMASTPGAQQALDDFKAALMNSNIPTGSWGHATAAACPADRPNFPRVICERHVEANRTRLISEVNAAKQAAAARVKTERAAERQAAFANPMPGAIKGEMPCLSGICLGDDLRSLPPIAWEEMRLTRNNVGLRSQRLTADEFERVKRAVAPQPDPVVRAIGPYLLTGAFDGTAIEQFKKIPAVCWRSRLIGAFVSESGYRTLVQVTPRAVDTRTQVLEVTLIKRTFTGIDSSARQKALEEDLAKRYEALVQSTDAERLERYTMTPNEIAAEKSWWHLNTRLSAPELFLVMANRRDHDPVAEAKLRELPGCELRRANIN